MTAAAFTGCILTGGASRRMGRDKALVEVAGRPLAKLVAGALTDAGADDVFCQGGDVDALRTLGLEAHSDSAPGEGPLAAILDAFESAGTDLLVVLSCDLPRVRPDSVLATVAGVDEIHPAAMPLHRGRPQYLHAAYDRRACEALTAAYENGERSMHRALSGIDVAAITVPDPGSLADADRPEDLE